MSAARMTASLRSTSSTMRFQRLPDQLQQLLISGVAADRIEVRIALEPELHVASDFVQIALQNVDGAVRFAQQRVDAGGVVARLVVVRVNRQGARRPLARPLMFAKSCQ